MANCKHIRIVGSQRGWRRDDSNLFHTRANRRDRCHQDRGRISCGTSGNTYAHSAERSVTLLQNNTWARMGRTTCVQNSRLKTSDIVAYSSDRFQEFRRRICMRLSQQINRHPQRLGRGARIIQSPRVVQHCIGAPTLNISTNSLHDPLRGEWFTEDRQG